MGINREFKKKSKKQNSVSNIESESENSGADTYIIHQRRSHYRPNLVRNELSTILYTSGSELHSHDIILIGARMIMYLFYQGRMSKSLCYNSRDRYPQQLLQLLVVLNQYQN